MPRPKATLPSYCLHKRSGDAYVTLNGRQVWLGKHGTPESRAAYDRAVGEHLLGHREAPRSVPSGLTVSELILAFRDHAQAHYVEQATNRDGSPMVDDAGKPVLVPSPEFDNYRQALRPLRRLYGSTPANEFGPLALLAVRNEMIKLDWCRKYINRQVWRIRLLFKWGVSREMVSVHVHQALETVEPLREGKSAARETADVQAVDEERVNAILPHLTPQVAALVQMELATGARGGELFIARTCDFDRSRDIWRYTPTRHKTQHHGVKRVILIPKPLQPIIEPFFKTDLTAYIFSPRDAAEATRLKRAEARKTPLNQGNKAGTNRRRRPARQPKLRYDRHSYARAVARACEIAFGMPAELKEPRPGTKAYAAEMKLPAEERKKIKVDRQTKRSAWHEANGFHPHQLRHTAMENMREQHGHDAAKAMVQHKTDNMTSHYAKVRIEKLEKILKQQAG